MLGENQGWGRGWSTLGGGEGEVPSSGDENRKPRMRTKMEYLRRCEDGVPVMGCGWRNMRGGENDGVSRMGIESRVT